MQETVREVPNTRGIATARLTINQSKSKYIITLRETFGQEDLEIEENVLETVK